ncbi:hypothetical protein ACROSR_13915 [Roseovarius tibetensis]|uniref:hypothetical protein n=1 Tax=Roseovarius tibetensis TaxID=2685897 RepID=UPI003D7F31ED
MGYVGMSLAVLLGRTQDVFALDIDQARVDKVNSERPTMVDAVMARETLSLIAKRDPAVVYPEAKFIVVATDYHPEKNHLNTTSVERLIDGR